MKNDSVKNGRQLEGYVEKFLNDLNIKFIRNFRSEKKFYGKFSLYEFVIPSLDLTIECKYQSVSGSVDEKWSYNIFKFFCKIFPTKNVIMLIEIEKERVGYCQFLERIDEILEFVKIEEVDRFREDFHIFTKKEDFERYVKSIT